MIEILLTPFLAWQQHLEEVGRKVALAPGRGVGIWSLPILWHISGPLGLEGLKDNQMDSGQCEYISNRHMEIPSMKVDCLTNQGFNAWGDVIWNNMK